MDQRDLIDARYETLSNTFHLNQPEQVVNFKDTELLTSVTSNSISDLLFPQIFADQQEHPPYLVSGSSIDSLTGAEEALRLRLFDLGIDLNKGQVIDNVDDETSVENFDIDYTLATLLDTKEQRQKWPELLRLGTTFTRYFRSDENVLCKERIRLWACGPVLAWCPADANINRSLIQNRIHLLQVLQISSGNPEPASSYFEDTVKESHCFSITTSKDQICLEADEEEVTMLWWNHVQVMLKRVEAQNEAQNALPSVLNSEYDKIREKSGHTPKIIHDKDEKMDIDFPDSRHVDTLQTETSLFPYPDDGEDILFEKVDALKATQINETEKMNRLSIPVYSDALLKEFTHDTRERAKYLYHQKQLAQKNKHYSPPSYNPPQIASQAWYQTIRDVKMGIRASSVAGEQSRQALPAKPLPSEFTSSTHQPIASPAQSDLRPKIKVPPSVLFEEMAPTVFARLRVEFGVPLSVFLSELCTNEFFIRTVLKGDPEDLPSKLKITWYSSKYTFKVESITQKEALFFLSWLPFYYSHMTEPKTESLLPKILGLYKLVSKEHPQGRYFYVSRNLFEGNLNLSSRYVINGQEPKDKATLEESMEFIPILRDGDLERVIERKEPALQGKPNDGDIVHEIEQQKQLALRPQQLRTFVKQLRRDIQLLAKVNAFEYSFSVGVHRMNTIQPNRTEVTKLAYRYGQDRNERELQTLEHNSDDLTNEGDLTLYSEVMAAQPAVEFYASDVSCKTSVWKMSSGGTVSSKWSEKTDQVSSSMSSKGHMTLGDSIYMFGITNIFKEFDAKLAWSQWWQRKEVGVHFVDPSSYALAFSSGIEARCYCSHPEFKNFKQKKNVAITQEMVDIMKAKGVTTTKLAIKALPIQNDREAVEAEEEPSYTSDREFDEDDEDEEGQFDH